MLLTLLLSQGVVCMPARRKRLPPRLLLVTVRRTFQGSAGDAESDRGQSRCCCCGRRGRPLREEAVKRATRTAGAVGRRVPRRRDTAAAVSARDRRLWSGRLRCRRLRLRCFLEARRGVGIPGLGFDCDRVLDGVGSPWTRWRTRKVRRGGPLRLTT